MYKFVLIFFLFPFKYHFLPARDVASNSLKRILCFLLFLRMEKTTAAHPRYTILRVFEAGILKIFKNIQHQPKNLMFV